MDIFLFCDTASRVSTFLDQKDVLSLRETCNEMEAIFTKFVKEMSVHRVTDYQSIFTFNCLRKLIVTFRVPSSNLKDISSLRYLESLRIYIDTDMTVDLGVFSEMKRLKSLDISLTSFVSECQPIGVLSSQSLNTLSIAFKPNPIELQLFGNLPCLRTLSLTNSYINFSDQAEKLSGNRNMSSLKYIMFKGCRFVRLDTTFMSSAISVHILACSAQNQPPEIKQEIKNAFPCIKHLSIRDSFKL